MTRLTLINDQGQLAPYTLQGKVLPPPAPGVTVSVPPVTEAPATERWRLLGAAAMPYSMRMKFVAVSIVATVSGK